MLILPMDETHIAALAELERLCFAQPWSEKGLTRELDNPHGTFRVAVEDEQLLGYSGMHCVAGECYIANVAVHPDARRQGVAQALVSELIRHAQAQSCDFITLEVRPSNTPAIALYKKLGFAEAGRRRRFYRDPEEDALLLTLTLPHGGQA